MDRQRQRDKEGESVRAFIWFRESILEFKDKYTHSLVLSPTLRLSACDKLVCLDPLFVERVTHTVID